MPYGEQSCASMARISPPVSGTNSTGKNIHKRSTISAIPSVHSVGRRKDRTHAEPAADCVSLFVFPLSSPMSCPCFVIPGGRRYTNIDVELTTTVEIVTPDS